MTVRKIQSLAAWASLVMFVLLVARMTAVMAGFARFYVYLFILGVAALLGWFLRGRLSKESAAHFYVEWWVSDFVVIVSVILVLLMLPMITSIWWYLFDRK